MSATTRHAPLPADELLGYWLGELEAGREAEIEGHLFECAECNGALGRLVALGDAVRALVDRGGAMAVVTSGFIERLKATGLRVHEYALEAGSGVDCTITPQQDLIVARLHAPLEGVQRLDVVIHEVEAGQAFRLEDVGFNAASREVVILPKATELRKRGVTTQRVELLAVTDAGDRRIGEYEFRHSPHRD
jgi:hypothetical protein